MQVFVAGEKHCRDDLDAATQLGHWNIDVSQAAKSVMFAGELAMDCEAFGVTVTRRPGATESNLTPYERARLLDVLCHAQSIQRQAQDGEKEFPIWIVSSDARDARTRAIWLSISKTDRGSYLIRLSDIQPGA